MAKTSTLTDAFTTYSTTTWDSSYGTPTVTSGQLHLSCVSSYEGIYRSTTYDLTSSYAYFEAVSVPTGGNGTRQAFFQLNLNSTNNIEVIVTGGMLYFRKTESGVTTTLHTVGAYNATNHRWWKVQSDLVSGTNYVSFWTSTNGFDWQQQGAGYTTSFAQTALQFEFGCGYFGTETSPPDFVMDNLNTPPTSVAVSSSDSTRPNAIFGVYKGYGQTAITAVATHEALVGRNVEIGNDYLPHTAWTDFNATTMRTYQLDPWRAWRDTRPGSKFVYGVPLLTDSNVGDFSGVVAGTYDSYFNIAAQALVDAGHPDAIIRLGWEPNNSGIGPWQATSNPSGYISAYQHVVTLFRAKSSNFTFELSSALGLQTGLTLNSFDSYYPGNSYVDYIGMNVYDIKVGDAAITNDARWNWIRSQTMGLDEHVAFVASKGKKNVCSEWGLYAANGSPDLDGGGDNPTFISRMYEYFTWGNVWYQSYFDSDWGGGTLSNYTNGQSRYASLFASPGVKETAQIAFTRTDTASATESASVRSVVSDTGSSAESQTISSSQTRSDTATGTEGQSISTSQTRSDTGTATEAQAIVANVSGSDTGTFTDSQSVSGGTTPSSSDASTIAENQSIVVYVYGSDSFIATEFGILPGAAPPEIGDYLSTLIMGPGSIYIADFGALEPADIAIGTAPSSAVWTDLGGITGGVDLTLKYKYEGLPVTQIPQNPASRLVKREMIVETALAEPQITSFLYGLNNGIVATGAGYKSYTPEIIDRATPLTYRAVIVDGWAPAFRPNGQHRRRRIILRKCLAIGDTSMEYTKDKQSLLTISWAMHRVDGVTGPFKVIDEI